MAGRYVAIWFRYLETDWRTLPHVIEMRKPRWTSCLSYWKRNKYWKCWHHTKNEWKFAQSIYTLTTQYLALQFVTRLWWIAKIIHQTLHLMCVRNIEIFWYHLTSLKTKRPVKPAFHEPFVILWIKFCRDDWIRTSGLFVPNEARYRAALHPDQGWWI